MKKFLLEMGIIGGLSGLTSAASTKLNFISFLLCSMFVLLFLNCLESYVKLVSKGE